MKKILRLLLLLLCTPLTVMAGNNVSITVNNALITDLDVQKRVRLMISSSAIERDKDADDALKTQVIEMLIDEQLIEQDAKSKKLKVEDWEIDSAIDDICKRNRLSKAEMAQYLKSRGTDLEALKLQLTGQLSWNKVMLYSVKHDLYVTDREVIENAAAIKAAIKKDSNQNTNVNLSEIVMYVADDNGAKTRALAADLVRDLKNGADFGKIAVQFSQSPSATSRGLIGWVYVNQLAPEIAKHVIKAEPGFITSPISIGEESIHILKVNDVKGKILKDEEIDAEEVRETLLDKKFDVAARAYIAKLRNHAYIKIKRS